KFTGDHVFRDSELPIHKVDTRIVMDDAVLSLKPLRFRYAYGDVDAALRFDGRSAPVKGTFNLAAHDVQLKSVFTTATPSNLDLVASNGDFTAGTFIIDTDSARFDISGNVDLANEKLDLVVRPNTKTVRVLSLRTPIHVTGPLRNPDVAIDKGVLLARSAGAI